MTAERSPVDPRYMGARRILLDALVALSPHRDAFIVAGAQAVYLRTGSGDLDDVIAPFTTGSDLAVNPSLLGDDPQLEAAMTEAGFRLKLQPAGHAEPRIWVAQAKVGDETFDVDEQSILESQPAQVHPHRMVGRASRKCPPSRQSC